MKYALAYVVLTVLVLCAFAGSLWMLLTAVRMREPVREYSLWLSPSGVQYDQLQKTVDELADKYPSHHFMPHVTVIGELKGTLTEVTAIAQRIADRTPVLEAPIKGIRWETYDVWRSFYLEVDEADPFYDLYDNTLEITGKKHAWPYHISLMYTKMPVSEREAIRAQMFVAHVVPSEITLDRIRICTSGDVPEEWTCPAEVHLIR